MVFHGGFTPSVDEADPQIDHFRGAEGEVPQNNTMDFEFGVSQNSKVTVPQDGTCQSGIFGSNVAWRTPYEVYVDGEKVDEGHKCVDGGTGTATGTVRLSFSEQGTHRVDFRVIKVPSGDVHDEVSRTVEVVAEGEARDPDAAEGTGGFLSDLADKVGASPGMLLLGVSALLALVMVI